MTDEQLLSMREAAEVLGVSPATVRRRITTGEIPARKEERAQGFRWVIAASDLDVPPSKPDSSDLQSHLAAAEATSRELRHAVERLEADLERQTNLASQAMDILQQERRHSHDLSQRLVQLLEVHPVRTPAALPEPSEPQMPEDPEPPDGTPTGDEAATAEAPVVADGPQDEPDEATPPPTEQAVTDARASPPRDPKKLRPLTPPKWQPKRPWWQRELSELLRWLAKP